MPELPEVETVRLGLQEHCLGKKIAAVQTLHPRATNPRSIAPLEVATGLTIKDIKRRGKFLWFTFDSDFALVSHLGMSGQYKIQNPGADDEKHLRVRYTLKSGRGRGAEIELRFVDQRTFGWSAISELHDDVPDLVSAIALDIFDPYFQVDEIVKKIRSKNSEIKRVILDQSVMSGVGNIYADESLWLARIHPQAPAHSLTPMKIRKLLDSIRDVMSQALVEGGTSFDALYIRVNGESGYFDRSLQAYGRENEPCSRCNTPITRIAFAGRSSHFCPSCQPGRI